MDFTNLNSASNFNSPKRKRYPPAESTIPPTPPRSSPPQENIPIRLNTNLSNFSPADNEGVASPRTSVAYNFQGLQLEDRADMKRSHLELAPPVVSGYKESMEEEDPHGEEEVARKRMKLFKERKELRTEIPETPDASRLQRPELSFSVIAGSEINNVVPFMPGRTGEAELKNMIDPVIFRGSPAAKVKGSGLARAYPSINRLADSKSRAKKRAGTPPLSSAMVAEESVIVDPVRAALTWHDDEITGHDPSDPEDDGEGINGIGFKPTAAEAYARTQIRKKAMAEYKHREAQEARKIRSERRRGADKEKAAKEAETAARKVRFMESEMENVISTS